MYPSALIVTILNIFFYCFSIYFQCILNPIEWIITRNAFKRPLVDYENGLWWCMKKVLARPLVGYEKGLGKAFLRLW